MPQGGKKVRLQKYSGELHTLECLDMWIRLREKMKFMKKTEREGRMCKPRKKKSKSNKETSEVLI